MRNLNKKEVHNEPATVAEKDVLTGQDVWEPAKKIAVRLGKSTSYIYSLVRRGSGIPYAEPSPGTILFSWRSVDKWLHTLEEKKARDNFEK